MRSHKAVDFIFKIYKYVFSPALHAFSGPTAGCRFKPTCSEFMMEAIKRDGLIRGGARGLKRLSQCHPFSKAV